LDTLISTPSRTGQDRALLAFVKCHLTSFLRWDLLRLMSDAEGRWFDSAELARQLQKPLPSVEATLLELETEDLVEVSRGPDGAAAYRMDPLGPTARVVERLVLSARRSQEWRQLIIARVLGQARAAS
jgi:hypothetical protein